MKKIDFKKELKSLYGQRAKSFSIVDVPEMQFLMIDGKGDPNNSPEFQTAVEALFSLSYNLKFMVKKGELATDYSVMPLEGLWWTQNMEEFNVNDKTNWVWTLMIMQPDLITSDMVMRAKEEVARKKKPGAIDKLRLERLAEGRAAQTLHIGPFSEEGPAIANLHEFIRENGRDRSGKHHEIYLSDPRRAAPEKLRTILRQPVE